MSRSRKKRPYAGWCCKSCDGDISRNLKTAAHRKYRRKCRQKLRCQGQEADILSFEHEVVYDGWFGPKRSWHFGHLAKYPKGGCTNKSCRLYHILGELCPCQRARQDHYLPIDPYDNYVRMIRK